MGDPRLAFYGAGALIAGIVLFFMGFKWYKQKKLIEDTPTSKVRSLAMGRVEVNGNAVKAQKVLTTPFSGQPCLWYRYTVEEYRQSGKHSRWVTVKKGTDMNHFYLKDDTGAVLIDPHGAQVDIKRIGRYSSVSLLPPHGKEFLEQSMIKTKGWLFNKQMRFTEYYIMEGDNLYIMGDAGDNPFVEDGSSQENHLDIMIQHGKRKGFFYISDKPETALLSKFKWKVIGGLFGGAGLIILGLGMIFATFGLL